MGILVADRSAEKRDILFDGVTLYRYREEYSTSIVFLVESVAPLFVTFVLDLSKSENVISEFPNSDLIFKLSLEPKSGQHHICRLSVEDPSKKAIVRCRKQWSVKGTVEESSHIVSDQTQDNNLDIYTKKALELGLDNDSLTLAQIESRCATNQFHFLDVAFLPTESSLNGMDVLNDCTQIARVRWSPPT